MNSNPNIERARPFGRFLRFLIGSFFLAIVFPYYFSAPANVIVQTILITLTLTLFYVVLDLAINNYFRSINPIIGAILANAPILLMWLLGWGGVQLGAITYAGIALIVTSLRADSGCEVMSIPGLIFKRHTHLACFFFSPIDWLEKRMTTGSL